MGTDATPHSAGPVVRFRRGLAVLAAAVAIAVPACTALQPTEDVAATLPEAGELINPGTGEPNASVPAETARPGGLLPVYWLGGSRESGGGLYREFLKAETAGDPIAAAVRAMTTETPLDPDYSAPWQPATMVSASISPRNVITVDISADAFATALDANTAYWAVQQLVYTATAAAANSGLVASGEPSSVVILVDGKAGFKAFGHVQLGSELRRDSSLVAPIWIINPQAGEQRDQSTVVVSGSGLADDSMLEWRIDSIDDAGNASMLKEGEVQVNSAPGITGLFEFTVSLPPGEYEIRVFDSSSAATGRNADTKTIVII